MTITRLIVIHLEYPSSEIQIQSRAMYVNFIVWNTQHKQFLFLRHKVDTSENHIEPLPGTPGNRPYYYTRSINSVWYTVKTGVSSPSFMSIIPCH